MISLSFTDGVGLNRYSINRNICSSEFFSEIFTTLLIIYRTQKWHKTESNFSVVSLNEYNYLELPVRRGEVIIIVGAPIISKNEICNKSLCETTQ